MKALHFGAGNIGRGFIGLLLSQSGFEITFAARNEKQVQLITQKGKYRVVFAGGDKDSKFVHNVKAIHTKSRTAVAEAIAESNLVTTAVGIASFGQIAESIAEGIALKLERGDKKPLHIIACENAMAGSSLLKQKVLEYLPKRLHGDLASYVAFPNTAVDRIVPAQDHEDPLQVTVESYYEWVIDASEMLEGFPDIKGVKYVDALEPYIERKLFTVNTGHAVAAYHGYLEGYDTIQEAMSDNNVRGKVVDAMNETGSLLTAKYDWDEEKHSRYIDKIIARFTNPKLKDEVTRVGRSPLRKLSLNDRLVRPALQAHKLGLAIPHLTSAIAAALLFDYERDPEAVTLQKALRLKGVDEVITQFMGIPHRHAIHQSIAQEYHLLKHRYSPVIV
ncbi:mannitol-1-phosphate 5-dehydrogenase [Paenibacillus sp. strain BS8-2]